MKGFYYFVMCASLSILAFAFNELLGILIILILILDAIVQGNCGCWKRLDRFSQTFCNQTKITTRRKRTK